MNNKFILPHNICLLGLPGSGKGYYGKMLSTIWNIPLYSTSQILKEISSSTIKQPQQQQSSTTTNSVTTPTTTTTNLMNTGKLIDCEYGKNPIESTNPADIPPILRLTIFCDGTISPIPYLEYGEFSCALAKV